MAEHGTIHSFIGTALAEYLVGSKLALEYRKSADWDGADAHGCLGMTSALLLFCVADAIGSYLRRDASFTVTIDGRQRQITIDGYLHLFVLNAPDLYGQNLSEKEIKALYDEDRSLLAHNAAIAANRAIIVDSTSEEPFPVLGGVRHVNLVPFHRLSCAAAERFLAGHDVDDSHAAGIIKARGRVTTPSAAV